MMYVSRQHAKSLLIIGNTYSPYDLARLSDPKQVTFQRMVRPALEASVLGIELNEAVNGLGI